MNELIKQHDGYFVTEVLQPYSEEDQQQALINKTNASSVYNPEFIPFYTSVKKEYKLNDKETLLYGFARFYLHNNPRFYFTNDQLGAVLDCSSSLAEKLVRTLKDKQLVDVGYKVKAGGGTVRFFKRVRLSMDGGSQGSDSPRIEAENLQGLRPNNNKINKNNTNTSTLSSLIEFFNEKFGKQYRLTSNVTFLIRSRLKTFSEEQIKQAISNLSTQAWATGRTERNWVASPSYLFKSDDKIDNALNIQVSSKSIRKPKLADFIPDSI